MAAPCVAKTRRTVSYLCYIDIDRTAPRSLQVEVSPSLPTFLGQLDSSLPLSVTGKVSTESGVRNAKIKRVIIARILTCAP